MTCFLVGNSYIPCNQIAIRLNKMNVFVKPNEQNDARINSAMARKGRMKSKEFCVFAQDLTVSRK